MGRKRTIMKIWFGYGSEHSANLVMVGEFIDAGGAEKAKQVINDLTSQVEKDSEAGFLEIGGHSDRYSDDMLDLLQKVHVHDVRPDELEQLGYEFTVTTDGAKLVLTTDESDVSAFLKILVGKGARVEVYSAHRFPDTKYGRGK
jgi:hypothetical protein